MALAGILRFNENASRLNLPGDFFAIMGSLLSRWPPGLVNLLRRSQYGLHRETNSLSLRSGERVRERGAWEIRDRFQAMFSRLSPLPGPLPARSSRGEGEGEAPPLPLPLSPILLTSL